jgi:UDP:flavonoid glycosyltransferase YjiC (YdhE family)
MNTLNGRKRILFIAETATLAHVVRPLVLAKALNSSCYEVHFACTSGYEHLLKNVNLTFWPIKSISEQQFLEAISKGKPPYNEKTLLNYIADDLRVINKIQPHFLVGDHRFSLAISAHVSKVPYAALTNAHWSLYSLLPRFPIPEHPMVNAFGLSVANFLARWVRPITFKLFARPVNRLRQKYGLPALGDLCDVHTKSGNFTLFADTPVFSPTINLPSNYRYIGPILWSPDTAIPVWWDEVSTERPCIYVTFGSSGQVDLLPIVTEALAELPVNVLVATASRLLLDSKRDNIWVTDYLPGTLAAQKSLLVICNGGSGTVHQALAAGIPVLGIPSNMDQHLVMTCVTQAGAGLLLRAGQTTRAKVSQAVAELLSNPDYRTAAQKVAEEFARYDVTREFPRFIDEVCRS